MGFRINTNVSALIAHRQGTITNHALQESLEKLSSGHKINKAADDASGMAIADNLRSQAHSLGQAIRNSNDAIGIIQTADKAMDEQIKILDTIKTKAIQAAQDGQSRQSRKYIQSDIKRLLEELDNIANTTSFNGKKLLSGQFNNKEFQVGAFSNETIKVSIDPTNSDKIGAVRLETGKIITASGIASLVFKNIDHYDYKLGSVIISTSPGTGLGEVANAINKISDKLNISASYIVESSSKDTIRSGDIKGLDINGTYIGNIGNIKDGDTNAILMNAINSVTDRTGVSAFVDYAGRLNLRSLSGRGIKLTTKNRPIYITKEPIKAGPITDMVINGIPILGVSNVLAGDSDGRLVRAINSKTDLTGVVASTTIDNKLKLENIKITRNITIGADLNSTTTVANGMAIKAGTLNNLTLMGVPIGNITVMANDSDKNLVNTLNKFTKQTGVVASMFGGVLRLIDVKNNYINPKKNIVIHAIDGPIKSAQTYNSLTTNDSNYGRLTLYSGRGKDILLSSTGNSDVGFSAGVAQETVNLRSIVSGFNADIASAAGANSNEITQKDHSHGLGVGVSTLKGAMVVMDLATSAMKQLDRVRADLGSVQQQLAATINNVSVTEVNLKAGESQIRDLDFAKESANLTKYNILSKSGNFALSQANTIQDNILKLLQ